MAKEKRVNARITEAQHIKLLVLIKKRGMTISQWIASRIDLARNK